MKCARCSGEIPEGSSSCPGCGLKVRMRAPEAGMPPPGPPIPSPPTEITREQELPPEDYQAVEPLAPGEWPPRDTLSAAPPQPGQAKRKTHNVIIAIIVIGLLVIGGAAAAYFFLLRNKGSATGPEAVVERDWRAALAGDFETAKACYAPGSQPSPAMLEQTRAMYQKGTFAIKELDLKTLKESDNEAEVEIVNLTVTVTMEGRSATINLQAAGRHLVVKLKKLDGKWLITGEEVR